MIAFFHHEFLYILLHTLIPFCNCSWKEPYIYDPHKKGGGRWSLNSSRISKFNCFWAIDLLFIITNEGVGRATKNVFVCWIFKCMAPKMKFRLKLHQISILKKKNALHLNIFSVISMQYKYCAYSMFQWVKTSQVILK